MENKTKLTLSKTNLILIVVGLIFIVGGFLIMTGEPTKGEFNPDIFSTRRIAVGPMISFFGYLFVIFAILFKKRNK